MLPAFSGTQRLIASTGCLAAAVLLHMMLCEWAVLPLADAPGRHLITSTYEKTEGKGNLSATMVRGVLTEEGVDRPTAIIYGLAAPGLLATLSITLLAGWRRARRIENGCCIRCGYDLNGAPAAGCPECGWRHVPVRHESPAASRDPCADGTIADSSASSHQIAGSHR